MCAVKNLNEFVYCKLYYRIHAVIYYIILKQWHQCHLHPTQAAQKIYNVLQMISCITFPKEK